MPSSLPSSGAPSGMSTPYQKSRFTAQASTAEDLLKSQTVGLVQLSDFRKRRAEALEQKEREAHDGSYKRFNSSGTATPSDGASTPRQSSKKSRKNGKKEKLSFAVDDEDQDEAESADSAINISGSNTLDDGALEKSSVVLSNGQLIAKRRLGPNSSVLAAPKAMTKSALLREAQTREQLRKEFLLLQETVKATEIVIPFVFYDGTNTPGGSCKVKKGDYIWVFLDRSRKLGAELGVGGNSGERSNNRRDWARVGVDDLILVRGEVIIPHHYEFYYFIVNKTRGSDNLPLFNYAAQPEVESRSGSSSPIQDLSKYDPLSRPGTKKPTGVVTATDSRLEGYNDDPNLTKVVDRRWYERNKHIFPASVWEEFDPTKDYSQGIRKDAEGNAFFFS